MSAPFGDKVSKLEARIPTLPEQKLSHEATLPPPCFLSPGPFEAEQPRKGAVWAAEPQKDTQDCCLMLILWCRGWSIELSMGLLFPG